MLRIAFWAGRLEAVLAAIRAAAAMTGVDPAVGGSAAAGVLHAALPGSAPPSEVTGFVTALRAELRDGPAGAAADGMPAGILPAGAGTSVIVLHAPPAVREAVDVWGPVPSLALMRAVKDQFDPEHRTGPWPLRGRDLIEHELDPDGELRELAGDCVHCGFCLPACPTYQLWGEEMDSPRGPHPPDHPDPGRRAGHRGGGRVTSTAAWAAWPACPPARPGSATTG